jgi:hypothetical protein
MVHKIIGTFEWPEDGGIQIPLLPLTPYNPYEGFGLHIIDFSYKCPVVDKCPQPDVSGQLIVHKVSGEVIKTRGTKVLHFVVRLSKPDCTMNVCGFVDDCSMDPWSDEFVAPFQNGYHTDRSDALYNYVVNLQAGK